MNDKIFMLSSEHKKEIKNTLKNLLARRSEVLFAYLHGSFIKAPEFRDIDVAVFTDESIKKEEALDYEIDLSIEFEQTLHLPVDIKILNFAPLGFQYHATKGELIFSREEKKRYDFLERVWREYLDFLPFIKSHLRQMLA